MDKKGKGKRTDKATEDEREYNYESFFRTKRGQRSSTGRRVAGTRRCEAVTRGINGRTIIHDSTYASDRVFYIYSCLLL